MFEMNEAMVGIVVGKWMVGIDWGRGLREIFVFVFDMDSDDEVWRWPM